MRVKKIPARQILSVMLVIILVISSVGCGASSVSEGTEFNDYESNSEKNTNPKIPEETNTGDGLDGKTESSLFTSGENNEETILDDSSMSNTKESTDDNLDEEELNSTTRNSINMLNYMTSLTQRVNEEKGNQLFLESAYDSFDNLFPNSVDTKTQTQITSLMDTIEGYRMITVKRNRLEYIYEQNRAKALRQAIPNPIGLLSTVESKDPLKIAISVLYMAVDSATSYQAAVFQADLQFIKDGWELDDAESSELHNSTKNALTYMLNMVRDYDIPGDYALSKEAVEDFVAWSSKSDSELERKISWFETNQRTYSEFGPYWLELAKDYYNYGQYEKCLNAVNKYESISTRIFRKDKDYALVLPMAIYSAKETMDESDYIKLAYDYCTLIHENTKDEDWTLRYIVAQILMDLYAISNERLYLDDAYKIARENVVILVDEQKKMNESYLSDIQELKPEEDATKRAKKEIKEYNKTIKAERKVALPPVSEALYLNTDLLFGLAKVNNIDSEEQKKINSILHDNEDRIFLTQALDDRFWFEKNSKSVDLNNVEIEYEGDKIVIPASCVTDRSIVTVNVSGSNGNTSFDKWSVDEVKRPKKSKDCSKFTVIYKNKEAGKYKYKEGEEVTVTVIPVEEASDEKMEFVFKVEKTKKLGVLNRIAFKRVKK